MEQEGPGGLVVVTDGRRQRSDPARDNLPNANAPVGSVGPNVPAGYGDTHAMYSAAFPPMEAQAWQGWPVGWDTPRWNEAELPKLVSTLWTCVDLNTRQLASFPTYGMRGLNATKLPEWANNPEPSTYSDWTEAAKQVFNTLQLSGECLLWCVGRYKDGPGGTDGSVARWVVLNPSFVNIERANGDIEYKLGTRKLDPKDVCHIKYQSMPNNLRGIGPLEWCAQSVVGAAAMERYGAELAANGGVPWGIMKTARHLNGAEADELRNRWSYAARNRNGAPAILSGDLSLETFSISPRDMALLDMRVFDETRIASAFGVPPFLIGLPQPDGLVYNNAESLFEYHWRSTLRTMATTVAGAISQWALPRGTRMEFDRDPYVQANPKQRAETYALLFGIVDEKGNRAITVDEIRMSERRLPNSPTEALETLSEGTHN